jgi:mannose-6-phosphate isomerase-like protein (cupin superfamily)
MLVRGKKNPANKLDLRILEIEQGTCTSKHYHVQSESVFYVLEGTAELEVQSTIVVLSVGDVVVVEPNEIHLIRNTGTSKCILIEAMSPPFTKKDIFYLEE